MEDAGKGNRPGAFTTRLDSRTGAPTPPHVINNQRATSNDQPFVWKLQKGRPGCKLRFANLGREVNGCRHNIANAQCLRNQATRDQTAACDEYKGIKST